MTQARTPHPIRFDVIILGAGAAGRLVMTTRHPDGSQASSWSRLA